MKPNTTQDFLVLCVIMHVLIYTWLYIYIYSSIEKRLSEFMTYKYISRQDGTNKIICLYWMLNVHSIYLSRLHVNLIVPVAKSEMFVALSDIKWIIKFVEDILSTLILVHTWQTREQFSVHSFNIFLVRQWKLSFNAFLIIKCAKWQRTMLSLCYSIVKV